MQTRTRAAVFLDRLLGSTALFGLSALWFASRVGSLLVAAVMAGLFTALAVYSAVLLHRRIHRGRSARVARAGEQRAAVYALTMLPYPEALEHAVQGLMRAYSLSSLYTVDGIHYVADSAGRRIAVRLLQSPQPATVAQVHDFHRARRDAHGALICAGGASSEASAYAARLSPPLRLFDAQTLPLPEALARSAPAQQAQKQRRAASILAIALRPAQTLRYLGLSTLLLLAYLLTNRLTALLPALVLLLLALLSKGRKPQQEEMFE